MKIIVSVIGSIISNFIRKATFNELTTQQLVIS